MYRKWCLCLGVLLFAGMLSGNECRRSFFAVDRGCAMIARAGGCGERPANTMEAFDHAIEAGADVIETDARLSKDGEVVLIEHEDVSLTTDGQGLVSELTLDELRSFDAGYWFEDPNKEGVYPYRGRGLKIPTLENLFTQRPDVKIIIELKGSNPDLADKVAKKMDQFEEKSRIVVGSRDEKVIGRFRKLMPEVLTTAVRSEIKTFYIVSATPLGYLVDPPACVFQIPVFEGKRRIAEPKFISRCRKKNVEVCIWTVNDHDEMKDLLKLDIQGIVTDFPGLLIKQYDK